MSISKEERTTNRFYRHSYMLLPIPIIASIVYAFYVVYSSDSKTNSYCIVATDKSAYQQEKLLDKNFGYREKITLDICKDKDELLDQSDGRSQGRVRWFTCRGTTCGPGWENILVER